MQIFSGVYGVGYHETKVANIMKKITAHNKRNMFMVASTEAAFQSNIAFHIVGDEGPRDLK